MADENLHAGQEVRNWYVSRRLDSSFPQLKPYLYPDARVLDVGCGPGSITLDVAQAVHPGQVYGIDPVQVSIDQANQIKAEQQADNVTFQIGRAEALDFPDDSFDLACSIQTLRWVSDPDRAVAELKRVLRPGGWAVCTLPEQGVRLMYPPCPAYDQVIAIRHAHCKDATDPDRYQDVLVGRRVVELFKKAGFQKLQIEPHGFEIRSAADGEPVSVWADLWMLNPEGVFGPLYDRLFSLGVLDPAMIAAAQAELESWAQNPYAFRVGGMQLIVAAQA